MECFCGPKEPLEPVVVNLYLAVVHKVEKAPEIIFANISEDDNGVLTRVALQEINGLCQWDDEMNDSLIMRTD